VDEAIHFLDLFGLDEIFGAKIGYLSGDARRIRLDVGNAIDGRYPGTPGRQSIPILCHARAQRRHKAKTSHYDSSLLNVAHD